MGQAHAEAQTPRCAARAACLARSSSVARLRRASARRAAPIAQQHSRAVARTAWYGTQKRPLVHGSSNKYHWSHRVKVTRSDVTLYSWGKQMSAWQHEPMSVRGAVRVQRPQRGACRCGRSRVGQPLEQSRTTQAASWRRHQRPVRSTPGTGSARPPAFCCGSTCGRRP